MKQKTVYSIAIALATTMYIGVTNADTVDERLKAYTAEGAGNFSAQAGEKLWIKDFPDTENPGKVRNCSTCHGEDLTKPGKHAKTGKKIDPLAPSANKERFTDAKFVEKWFKRNCKWVLDRECTAQEKGDFLMYLRNK
ncbi:MAG: DUF1924 domain-containing protein [Gammaproteobacteria bacterium]|nr:DUF1924 domain-containing protein [Gammaproteobacteria bacterium]